MEFSVKKIATRSDIVQSAFQQILLSNFTNEENLKYERYVKNKRDEITHEKEIEQKIVEKVKEEFEQKEKKMQLQYEENEKKMEKEFEEKEKQIQLELEEKEKKIQEFEEKEKDLEEKLGRKLVSENIGADEIAKILGMNRKILLEFLNSQEIEEQ